MGSLFLFTIMGMMTLALYVLEVQAVNQSVQAASRWAVAGVNLVSPGGGQIALPQCGLNASPAGQAPAGMITVAQAAAGPFGANIDSTTMETAAPDTSQGTIGCVVTLTLPYRVFGLPFGLSLGNVTATATDYVT